jgi:hypothetical protein
MHIRKRWFAPGYGGEMPFPNESARGGRTVLKKKWRGGRGVTPPEQIFWQDLSVSPSSNLTEIFFIAIMTLPENYFRINQTLIFIFHANPDEKFLSRP